MANNKRFVQLFTWWITPKGTRQFCVVDKSGKFMDEDADGGKVSIYRTTQVKLIETLNPNPVNYAVEDFWDLVDRGRLVEYIPGVTVISSAKEAPERKDIPWMNPENYFH